MGQLNPASEVQLFRNSSGNRVLTVLLRQFPAGTKLCAGKHQPCGINISERCVALDSGGLLKDLIILSKLRHQNISLVGHVQKMHLVYQIQIRICMGSALNVGI